MLEMPQVLGDLEEVKDGPLTAIRTQQSSPKFKFAGIDYFDPLLVKRGRKIEK